MQEYHDLNEKATKDTDKLDLIPENMKEKVTYHRMNKHMKSSIRTTNNTGP